MRLVVDRVNALHHGLQRSGAFCLDARLVHAREVEIADLLLIGTTAGGVGGSLLQNIAQDHLVALMQLVEPSPFRLVSRDRIVLQPVAAGVLVEVSARIDGLVHRVDVEAGDGLHLPRGSRRWGRVLRLHRNSNQQQDTSDKSGTLHPVTSLSNRRNVIELTRPLMRNAHDRAEGSAGTGQRLPTSLTYNAHQTRQAGSRTIGWPALQPKASRRAAEFCTAPFTRQRPGECGSVIASTRACWSVTFWHQIWPYAMKNRCCGVKPSIGFTGV